MIVASWKHFWKVYEDVSKELRSKFLDRFSFNDDGIRFLYK